jgi:hypothetical protein
MDIKVARAKQVDGAGNNGGRGRYDADNGREASAVKTMLFCVTHFATKLHARLQICCPSIPGGSMALARRTAYWGYFYGCISRSNVSIHE